MDIQARRQRHPTIGAADEASHRVDLGDVQRALLLLVADGDAQSFLDEARGRHALLVAFSVRAKPSADGQVMPRAREQATRSLPEPR